MKILFFGPLAPPYTGQSIAFNTIIESYNPKEIITINSSKYRNSILSSIYAILATFYAFVFYRFSTIYFTSSRTLLGFIKEFPLITLGRWFNKRIINHLHGADFKNFYQSNYRVKPLIRYAYNSIETSIVLIKEMKDQYSDFPSMKVIAIANCYSKELDSFEGKYKKRKQILYLSNLMASKGIFEFLKACEVILDQNTEFIVKIAGSPFTDSLMDKKTIKAIFDEKYKNLKDKYPGRIEYLGVIHGKQKCQVLYESSIFVLPSYYSTEAFPISILEAMRTGNAIITTNHNYLPYIINSENGKIIKKKSHEAIIEAINKLIESPSKLLSIQEKNRSLTKKKYTESKYIYSIKTVINTP